MSTVKRLGISRIKKLRLENIKEDSDDVYEIKSIKIITPLEDGNANDGKKTNTQKGMLQGKNYTFEVAEYVGKRATELASIKWELSYTNPDTGEVVDLPINARGERITMNMGNLESCGRYLYIRAYISDKKNSAILKVWKHNRFRWFDQLYFEKELAQRLANPWEINQKNTSLCGMACIFYLFAENAPSDYRKFCKDLFRKGEATYNNYIVKPTTDIIDRKSGKDGLPSGNSRLSIVDYITLAGTRNTENPKYKGGDEDFQAINWTNIMLKLCEKLLGYNDVESNNAYDPIKYSENDGDKLDYIITDLNTQINDEYKLILLIDSDLISKDDDNISNLFQLEYHWITLESNVKTIQNFDSNGNIFYTFDFHVYSWGTDPYGTGRYLKKPITKGHFIKNYYGYIKLK